MRKADLNRSNVAEPCMSIGRSFQARGAAWLNTRQATTVLVSRDCCNSKLDELNYHRNVGPGIGDSNALGMCAEL